MSVILIHLVRSCHVHRKVSIPVTELSWFWFQVLKNQVQRELKEPRACTEWWGARSHEQGSQRSPRGVCGVHREASHGILGYVRAMLGLRFQLIVECWVKWTSDKRSGSDCALWRNGHSRLSLSLSLIQGCPLRAAQVLRMSHCFYTRAGEQFTRHCQFRLSYRCVQKCPVFFFAFFPFCSSQTCSFSTCSLCSPCSQQKVFFCCFLTYFCY